MASKRTAGSSRSAVIRCPNCGEDYSVTYKRCPFCDEKAAEKRKSHPREEDGEDLDLLEEEDHPRGGKRLGGSSHRGWGESPWTTARIVRTGLSLAVIVAAVVIVATQVVPLVNRANQVTAGGDSSAPPATSGITESVAPTDSLSPESTAPTESTPLESTSPTPETSSPEPTVPADQTATSFTLSRTDFTMNDNYPEPVRLAVTFIPDGTTGTITWTSSDPEVATVDSTGLVTRGSKNGQTTITATMGDGTTQECTVRCNFSSASQGSTSGTLSLNRSDFTLQRSGETFRMQVSGTSSTPTWSIGNTSVATVSSDGTVTAVGEGNTTLTCTVDGQTLTCIVRCDF